MVEALRQVRPEPCNVLNVRHAAACNACPAPGCLAEASGSGSATVDEVADKQNPTAAELADEKHHLALLYNLRLPEHCACMLSQ